MGPIQKLKKNLLLAFLLLVPGASVGAAQAGDTQELFPPVDEVFHILLADPRQARSTLRYYRWEGMNLGDASLGNVWGLWRWTPDEQGGWTSQLNASAMAYSRFELSGAVNEFQTIDFFINIPLELRRGDFSARIQAFHESSHLGDDYIRRTKVTGFRYSVEGINAVGSYELNSILRVYAGGLSYMHGVPRGQKGALQTGFEIKGPDMRWHPERPAWLYLAQDFQFLGRVQMNMNTRTELGVHFGVPRVVRAARAHIGYFAGHSEFGQFFSVQEHYFDLGVTFDF